jgi:endo-1,4-beta-mannosidase
VSPLTNIKRIGGKILVDEGFKFLLGVNYWPRKLNIRMWRDWDDSAIREDLNLMKNIGIRAVRFFIKNEDFADENANVFPHALEKLGRFLDLLREHNIMGFATLIVGHMSGKNWEIPWLRPEEIYTSHGIERTMRCIETIVTRFSAHPAIAGWILSNELSLVRRAEKREEALALLRLYSKIVSSIARSALVSSGDLVDSYMQEPPNVSSLVDYIGLHLYLHDSDPVRHGYTYGAIIELFSNDNTIPVIVEEFGFSTYQYSEEKPRKIY